MEDNKTLLLKTTETHSTYTQTVISYLFRLRGLGSKVSDGLTIHNLIFFISPPPPLPLSFELFTCHKELFPSLSLCLNSGTSAYNITIYKITCKVQFAILPQNIPHKNETKKLEDFY
jgi:hypothetical protein